MKLSALDVISNIAIVNDLSYMEFNIYNLSVTGWKPGTLEHFKDDKAKGKDKRRDPKEALEHSSTPRFFVLSRHEIATGMRNRIGDLLAENEALQVLSRTRTAQSADVLHIPLLDLEIKPEVENLSYVVDCLRALGERHGYILLSGASYHYYGLRPLTEDAWTTFMYRSLLLDGVVDARWVAYRLIDKHARLRISKKGNHNFIPYVVREL